MNKINKMIEINKINKGNRYNVINIPIFEIFFCLPISQNILRNILIYVLEILIIK